MTPNSPGPSGLVVDVAEVEDDVAEARLSKATFGRLKLSSEEGARPSRWRRPLLVLQLLLIQVPVQVFANLLTDVIGTNL